MFLAIKLSMFTIFIIIKLLYLGKILPITLYYKENCYNMRLTCMCDQNHRKLKNGYFSLLNLVLSRVLFPPLKANGSLCIYLNQIKL